MKWQEEVNNISKITSPGPIAMPPNLNDNNAIASIVNQRAKNTIQNKSKFAFCELYFEYYSESNAIESDEFIKYEQFWNANRCYSYHFCVFKRM